MPKNLSAEEAQLFARLQQNFLDEYPTEEDCREALIQLASMCGNIRCRTCGGKEFQRKYGDSVGKCDCGTLNWLLSETLFFRIRRPRAWWAAIWLMLNSVVVNSGMLSRLTGVASSTAQGILKRIAIALELQVQDSALTAPSVVFMGIVSRRSRETPAGKHPRHEEERQRMLVAQESPSEFGKGRILQPVPETDSQMTRETKSESDIESDAISESEAVKPANVLPIYVDVSKPDEESNLPAFELGETEIQVYESLSSDPLHIDTLCERICLSIGEILAALMMLEFKGLCSQPYSNCYVRAEPEPKTKQTPDMPVVSEEVEKSAVYATEFLRANFDGISRKYLQPYLAITAFHLLESATDKLNALADACSRLGRISQDRIIAYVTPLTVRLAPLKAAPESLRLPLSL